MKKSLLFGLLAVLAAVFIFTACDNGTTSTEGPGRDVEVPIEVDTVVDGVTALKALLVPAKGEPSWAGKIIGLSNTAPIVLGEELVIPANHTVYVIGNTILSTGNVAARKLTVKGHLRVLAEATLVVPEDFGPIVVEDDGSIIVENEASLSLYKASDINDGTTKKPVTLLGNTSKIKLTGGTLTLDVFTTLADLTKAFASVESGELTFGNLIPLKPSDITGFPITKDKKITVSVSKAETETSLSIPVGLALKAFGNLSSITDLTVAGDFEASGNLSKITTLTIEAGSTSKISGNLSGLTTLDVDGTLNTVDATFPASTTTGVKVTVGEDGDLTLGTVSLDDSTIEGKLAVGNTRTVTVRQNAKLIIINPDLVSGAGFIKAKGSTNGGTIVVGSEEGFVYTTGGTPDVGVVGASFDSAVKAIEKDYINLTSLRLVDGLTYSAFGTMVEESAIGSIAVAPASTSEKIPVYKNGAGTATGDQFTLANANSALVESAYTQNLFGRDIGGTDGAVASGGTGLIADATKFSAVVNAGVVNIVDAGWVAGSAKAGIVTFKNYLPSNSDLIGPEDYVVSFSVGVKVTR